MPKVNFHSLSRPAQITETREFSDPTQPDVKFSLEFAALDEPAMFMVADETVKQLIARVGDQDTNTAPTVAPIAVAGKVVKLSQSLIQTVVTLCMMQTTQDVDEAYTFEQFVAMSVTMPTAFRAVSSWANEINAKFRGKKDSEQGEGNSSAQQSEQGNPTPTS